MKELLIFAAGVACGALAGRFYFKKQYEDIANNEIESVKRAFGMEKENENANSENKPEEKIEETKEDTSSSKVDRESIVRMNQIIQKENYSKYSSVKKPIAHPDIYVIPPEEMGDKGYDLVTWQYFSDNVLVDECDEVVDDITLENTIGADSLNHFGEYEGDSVCVRNDSLQIDYEVLQDLRKYSDLKKRSEESR